jgi:hypothetical protein
MMNFFASHSKITSTRKNENHALIKNVQLNCPSIENKTSLYRQILFHSIDSSSTINCYSLNLKIFLRQVLHPHLISLQVFIPKSISLFSWALSLALLCKKMNKKQIELFWKTNCWVSNQKHFHESAKIGKILKP